MTLSELINNLQITLEENGDIPVTGIANGEIHEYVDTNVDCDADGNAVVYIELAD